MKITNTHGLPDVLVKACSDQRKPTQNSISCTELIDSPLVRRLKLQHWDTLESDVSEMVWAMTGTALHQMLEKHGASHMSEVKLSAEIDGMTITGTCDHLTPERISDWKTTSVWSVMIGKDWLTKVAQQLNVYRYLHYRMTNELIPRASAVVIFRDWRRSEQRRNPSEYQDRNVMEYEVRPWTVGEMMAFIHERLEYHKDENYVCSMEERWAKADSWAVKKPGAARALRVFDNAEEAYAFQPAGTEVEHRPGEHVRCQEFCPVRDVCKFKVNREVF